METACRWISNGQVSSGAAQAGIGLPLVELAAVIAIVDRKWVVCRTCNRSYEMKYRKLLQLDTSI